mmetsp:Transcript_65498/g.126412  ORF Transcript_65498/g.126412 Transcript_65498/m.126412 type:complete len:233 (-) Transcript_65498:25-723(-)
MCGFHNDHGPAKFGALLQNPLHGRKQVTPPTGHRRRATASRHGLTTVLLLTCVVANLLVYVTHSGSHQTERAFTGALQHGMPQSRPGEARQVAMEAVDNRRNFGGKTSFADKKKRAKAEKEVKKKKDNVIEMDGRVIMHSRNIFKVELTNGAEVDCTLAGRLRQNSIKVLEGDAVTVELSPFDLSRGRITFRRIDSSLLESKEAKAKRLQEEAREERKAAEKEARAAAKEKE